MIDIVGTYLQLLHSLANGSIEGSLRPASDVPAAHCLTVKREGSGQSGLSESDKVSSVQKRRHAGACAAAKRGFKSKMLCFPQHWETYIVYNGVFSSKDQT